MLLKILHLQEIVAIRAVVPASLAGLFLFAASASAQTGPVAAYGFNQNSGTTTDDASGNGLTETLQGATWTATGKYGKALSFNGSASY